MTGQKSVYQIWCRRSTHIATQGTLVLEDDEPPEGHQRKTLFFFMLIESVIKSLLVTEDVFCVQSGPWK